jgi:hypothetical protein
VKGSLGFDDIFDISIQVGITATVFVNYIYAQCFFYRNKCAGICIH